MILLSLLTDSLTQLYSYATAMYSDDTATTLWKYYSNLIIYKYRYNIVMILYVMPLLLMLSVTYCCCYCYYCTLCYLLLSHNISSSCHLYDPLHFNYLFTPLHTSVKSLTLVYRQCNLYIEAYLSIVY